MKAIRIILILWLLTALIYPSSILGIAQIPFFSEEANGKILYSLENQPIGSVLIGQRFTSNKYFHSRPSAIRYSQSKSASPTGISGGSNLAPTNPNLFNRVMATASQLQEEDTPAYADLIYTSASGLDPHISLRAARSQMERVAQARGLDPQDLIRFIVKDTDTKFLRIFGQGGVNVLRLNYRLDLKDIDRQGR